MKIINPEYKPNQELGENDAAWTALKTKLRAFFAQNASKPTVSLADARKVDPKLADERVWTQIQTEMGLITVPDPREEGTLR